MGVRVKVLEVLSGNRAIISTRGFCRVVLKPGDEIAVELVNPAAAKFYAEAFNSVSTNRLAVIERYKSPKAVKPFKPAKADRRPFRSAV